MRCLMILTILLCAIAQAQFEDLTRQLDWVPQRSSSANEDLGKNGDARPIPAGEELVIADLEGPGVITHIWCTIGAIDIFHGRSHVLRVYYDGNEKPSVEVPLGDFFGVGNAAMTDYSSSVANTSSFGRARTCYWRMPFHEAVRVTVANEGDKDTDSFYFYVDWEKHESLPDDTVYFHAQYRQENPTTADDFLMLDTRGRGHYVGTVYSVLSSEIGWFGEGDDRFYVDGEEYPSLSGTGTEDYFADAWGFRKFDTPYYGVSVWEGYYPGDRGTAYRWHLADPIPFKESLRFQIETRGSVFNPQMTHLGQFLHRQDFISGAAFWYQWPLVELAEPLPPVAERIPPYRLIPAGELEARAEPSLGFSKSGDGVAYMGLAPKGVVEVDFTVPEDGLYQVNAILQYGVVGGVYQVSLNDKPLGEPIDFWYSGMDPVWTRFDVHELKAGETYTLTFEGQGPSPKRRTGLPPIQGMGMNALVLLRLEDIPGYQKTMNAILEKKAAAEGN